jgi:hypothetical protein
LARRLAVTPAIVPIVIDRFFCRSQFDDQRLALRPDRRLPLP